MRAWVFYWLVVIVLDGFAAINCPAQLSPELTIQAGHFDKVVSLAVSPDGRALASGGYDGTARLWDLTTGIELRSLKGHTSSVQSVAFSHDGRFLATGSDDKTIRVWDVSTGAALHLLTGHTESVQSLKFDPEQNILASASFDKSICLWDVSTGKLLRKLIGHSQRVNAVAFSPDGKILASGDQDGTVRLWKMPNGSHLGVFKSEAGSVNCLAFSPDGKTLATGSALDRLDLWDILSSSLKRSIKATGLSIFSIAFSPNGNSIATADVNAPVELWDPETGKHVRSFSPTPSRLGENYPTAVAFSRDGTTLIAGGSAIYSWEVATGVGAGSFRGTAKFTSQVRISPNGIGFALGGQNGFVGLWNDVMVGEIRLLSDEREQEELFRKRNLPEVLSFSSDGTILSTGSADGTIKIWNTSTGRLVYSVSHGAEVNAIVFSHHGQMFATAGDDEKIRLWRTSTGKELRSLRGYAGGTDSVAFSPDDSVLLAANGSRLSEIVDTARGEIQIWDNTYHDLQSFSIRTGRRLLSRDVDRYEAGSLAFSTDGRLVAIGNYRGGSTFGPRQPVP